MIPSEFTQALGQVGSAFGLGPGGGGGGSFEDDDPVEPPPPPPAQDADDAASAVAAAEQAAADAAKFAHEASTPGARPPGGTLPGEDPDVSGPTPPVPPAEGPPRDT